MPLRDVSVVFELLVKGYNLRRPCEVFVFGVSADARVANDVHQYGTELWSKGDFSSLVIHDNKKSLFEIAAESGSLLLHLKGYFVFIEFFSETEYVRAIEVFGDDEDWTFKGRGQLDARPSLRRHL